MKQKKPNYRLYKIFAVDESGNRFFKSVFVGGNDFSLKNGTPYLTQPECHDGYYLKDYEGNLFSPKENEGYDPFLPLAYSLEELADEEFEKNTNRLDNNLSIIESLKTFAEEHPDLRFGQMLDILKINADFEEESSVTSKKLIKTLENLKKNKNGD